MRSSAREVGEEPQARLAPRRVAAGELDHRPVAAPHQPLRTKALDQVRDLGAPLEPRPSRQPGPASVSSPESLQHASVSRAIARMSSGPCIEATRRDLGLGPVVDHHAKIGMTHEQLAQPPEMPRGQDGDVVKRSPSPASAPKDPTATAWPSIQSSSAMSWIIGRTPRRAGCAASDSRVLALSA